MIVDRMKPDLFEQEVAQLDTDTDVHGATDVRIEIPMKLRQKGQPKGGPSGHDLSLQDEILQLAEYERGLNLSNELELTGIHER